MVQGLTSDPFSLQAPIRKEALEDVAGLDPTVLLELVPRTPRDKCLLRLPGSELGLTNSVAEQDQVPSAATAWVDGRVEGYGAASTKDWNWPWLAFTAIFVDLILVD